MSGDSKGVSKSSKSLFGLPASESLQTDVYNNKSISSQSPAKIIEKSDVNQSTPAETDPKKRPLSSPLDFCQAKKQLIGDMINSEGSSESSNVVDISLDRASAQPTLPCTPLRVEDIKVIAATLKASFRDDMASMVKSVMKESVGAIVDGVLEGLHVRIASLETINKELLEENNALKKDNAVLKGKVHEIEKECDGLEQYSRRNSLRITGIPESEENTKTDKIVLDMCKDIGVTLTESDIDRSHRVGKPSGPKPRQIIVKFTSYRSRQQVYKARSRLKASDYKNVHINEDLTKIRNKLLYDVRQLLKNKNSKVDGVWSTDDVILVKDTAGRIHRILSRDDLSPFV